jgi:hypothetical protein
MTTGILRRNRNGRWAIDLPEGAIDGPDSPDSVQLTSGDVVEVQIAGHWISTSVEHDGKDYYAATRGVRLCAGLPARIG